MTNEKPAPTVRRLKTTDGREIKIVHDDREVFVHINGMIEAYASFFPTRNRWYVSTFSDPDKRAWADTIEQVAEIANDTHIVGQFNEGI